jgi:hypothetical protein
MRAPIAVLLQIVASLLIVGLVMPVVLASVPSARDGGVGSVLALVALGTTFVMIRLLWPRRRGRS